MTMKFIEAPLKGVYIIQLEKQDDIRGFFARTFDIKEFEEHGIDFNIAQTSISYNKIKGTLRGMHFQDKPYEEHKIVQCIKGSIYDVIVDIRNYSETYKQWYSVELSDKNYSLLYIPKGFAHGYQTLEDDTLLYYFISQFYSPDHTRTLKWNDPTINIKWKIDKMIMSNKDK